MPLFRRKPLVIKAEQYTEYGKLVRGMCNSQSCYVRQCSEPHVHTMHDNQIVLLTIGDWVFPEIDGEHYYPVKDSEIRRLYEQVPEKCTACGNNPPEPNHPDFLCTRCIDNP